MNIKKISSILLCVFWIGLLAACTGFPDELKDTKSISKDIDLPPSDSSNSDSLAIKYSPGRIRARSSNSAIDATITVTNRNLSGGDMSATVSLGRDRASQ